MEGDHLLGRHYYYSAMLGKCIILWDDKYIRSPAAKLKRIYVMIAEGFFSYYCISHIISVKIWCKYSLLLLFLEKGRKEMFYLMMHSTHFILWLYGVGHMVKDHSDSERGNPLPQHGLLWLTARVLFICTITHTKNTGLVCYTYYLAIFLVHNTFQSCSISTWLDYKNISRIILTHLHYSLYYIIILVIAISSFVFLFQVIPVSLSISRIIFVTSIWRNFCGITDHF